MAKVTKHAKVKGLVACALAVALAANPLGAVALAEEAATTERETVANAQDTGKASATDAVSEQKNGLSAEVAPATTEEDQDKVAASDADGAEAPSEDLLQTQTEDVRQPNDQAAGQDAQKASEQLSVLYQSHVQSYGWQEWRKDGELAGTSGEAKRLESLLIKLQDAEGKDVSGITYKAHVQSKGWTEWLADGAEAGTTGMSKRIEALRIKLSDELAQKYDVLYRVHIQSYGWLEWAANGEAVGSTGQGKRIEAIQIKLQEKGSTPVRAGGVAFYDGTDILLNAHVENIGWQGERTGEVGTSGRSLRMEAVTARLNAANEYSGDIVYQCHAQTYGWMSEVSSGGIAGTEGESKRVEAFNFRLTGEVAEHYDVYYRAHVQTLGWLGWAKNGENTGTAGLARRMESLQVRLVPKGADASEFVEDASVAPFVAGAQISFDSSYDGILWQGARASGGVSGTVGGEILDMLRASLVKREGCPEGDISYQVRPLDGEWSQLYADGEDAGASGACIEAMRVTLTGDLANLYDVYYRTHIANKGWLKWAVNGADAGTIGYGTGIDAYQISLVPKFDAAPSNADADIPRTVYDANERKNTIEKYLGIAVSIANDNSHGYSQYNRWGPDYDCSSFVITCLQRAGLDTADAVYTGNMIGNLRECGWLVIPFRSRSQLERGDILLNVTQHTEFYLGDGKNVGAMSSEYYSVSGYAGDQDGHEIAVVNYHGDGLWEYVLRLK